MELPGLMLISTIRREEHWGLIAIDGEFYKTIHRGGALLTGIFYVKNRIPQIVHRSSFNEPSPDLALQAGPRIIAEGKALNLSNPDIGSRRSGIATTKRKEIIIYITKLRFPGTSLRQIQDLLLKPELEITDALNLDGGGSSQLYVKEVGSLEDEIEISGGDLVPTALIIKERKK